MNGYAHSIIFALAMCLMSVFNLTVMGIMLLGLKESVRGFCVGASDYPKIAHETARGIRRGAEEILDRPEAFAR